MMSSFAPIDDALRTALGTVPVCVAARWLEARGLRSRAIHGLRPANPDAARLCGPAWTLRSIAVREDIRDAVSSGRLPSLPELMYDAVPAGAVIVCATGMQRRIAMLGDMIAGSLQVRGLAGVVVDAGLSDAAIIGRMTLPVFATGSTPVPSYATTMLIDHGRPIGIGEVAVFPGDIMLGDADGLICIPRHLADALAHDAARPA